jgi:hypothetical protein
VAVREPGPAHRGKAPSTNAIYRAALYTNLAQGFDEFMNVVIDDAVEVKLATKDTSEERRSVGQSNARTITSSLTRCRSNPAQGRQYLPDSATAINANPPLSGFEVYRSAVGIPNDWVAKWFWVLHEQTRLRSVSEPVTLRDGARHRRLSRHRGGNQTCPWGQTRLAGGTARSVRGQLHCG